MLFITNRIPQGNLGKRYDGSSNKSYDRETKTGPVVNTPITYVFDSAKDDYPNQHVFFCCREAENDYLELGNEMFFNKLKSANYQQILLYIHGLQTQPEEAFQTAKTLQGEFDVAKKDEILVVPVIWPSENNLVEYGDARFSAEACFSSFYRALKKFHMWIGKNPGCNKRINIFAFSLGNRVLRATLEHGPFEGKKPLRFFENTFIVAADIPENTFYESESGGKSGVNICYASRKVIVYYAQDDKALWWSDWVNSDRLGREGIRSPQRLLTDNVYTVDCSNVNGNNRRHSHNYFTNQFVFAHILNCIVKEGNPESGSFTARGDFVKK